MDHLEIEFICNEEYPGIGWSLVEVAVPDRIAANVLPGERLVARLGTFEIAWEGEEAINCMEIPANASYREPTQADVGKTVEVSDCKKQWLTCELLAVLPDDIYRRFIVRGNLGDDYYSLKYARIKIEEVPGQAD